jgi:phosphatidylinositol alpha-mannosyltransferase
LGIDARILAPCDGPPPDTAVTPLGNSIPTASNGSMAAIAPDPSAVLRTIRALRDEDFDVVHLHEPLVPGPSLTALLFNDGPMIGTFHRSGDSGWYDALRPLIRWGARQLTIRAAVSEEARDTAWRALGGSYELVWNGIDIELFQGAKPWPKDGPVVMFVGRHEPRKGLAVLIEAVRSLPDDIRVWIAGEGPETERLRAATASEPRFEWLGLITEQEKTQRMRAADLLCAPSLHGESFGVILLEGMAAGVPVVASDLDGYRQVARPGVDALMAPPGDAGALADALKTALDGGPDVKALVENALERAATFSLDTLAERYAEMYGRALSAGGGQSRDVRRRRWRLL